MKLRTLALSLRAGCRVPKLFAPVAASGLSAHPHQPSALMSGMQVIVPPCHLPNTCSVRLAQPHAWMRVCLPCTQLL